tara:strand:+ start:167 stop:496 length:330 start_codon:yes stop_codon:yes gene_type:complete
MKKKSDSFSGIIREYEQNIGLLTHSITDKLLIASKIYSYEWIREAILDAKDKDRKNWTYVQKYLEIRQNKKDILKAKKGVGNAKSSKFFNKSNQGDDPYQSVIKRSWKK